MSENMEMSNETEDRQRILLADDESSIRRILETRLKMAGYDVYTAQDGEEAVAAFNKYNPDLVVLDVMMPKMDGYGVTREIRRSSDVPIIILTALGDVSERITGLELGADDYVIKPFSPKELEARVKAVLRRTNNREMVTPSGKVTKNVNDRTCFLFGNMFDKYLNKKIQSIKVVLTRTFDGDYNKDALLSIKYHSYRYLDELQELSSNGQLPSLSTWAKAITFEGWKESENVNTRVFMINDVDLLNDIERGIVKGFNLNLMPLSECDYAVFNNMEVIIEYKNN